MRTKQDPSIIPKRILDVHERHAVDLPEQVKSALEAHMQNLIALYDNISVINQDEDYLEKQALHILMSYQEELIKALRASV